MNTPAHITNIKPDKQQPDEHTNGGPNEAETSYITKARTKTKQTKKKRKKTRNPRPQAPQLKRTKRNPSDPRKRKHTDDTTRPAHFKRHKRLIID
jgi:hypothetical protein